MTEDLEFCDMWAPISKPEVHHGSILLSTQMKLMFQSPHSVTATEATIELSKNKMGTTNTHFPDCDIRRREEESKTKLTILHSCEQHVLRFKYKVGTKRTPVLVALPPASGTLERWLEDQCTDVTNGLTRY